MIYQLKDGPLTIGFGRSLDEAIQFACSTNRQVGDTPTDPLEMKAMIDNGTIKVREIMGEVVL
jgi:hypothetical protein